MTWRREALEEIDGYDRNLAYGEDMDIGARAQKAGIKSKDMDAIEYITLPQSISEVFRQGRWYGKSMIPYFRKHPKAFPSAFSVIFFASLPFVTVIAAISDIAMRMAGIQYLLVSLYVLEGFRRTKNP